MRYVLLCDSPPMPLMPPCPNRSGRSSLTRAVERMVALLPVSHIVRTAFTLRFWSRLTNSHSVTTSSASGPRFLL